MLVRLPEVLNLVKVLKVLHINNTAGIGSLIIKELSSRPYYRFDMLVYGKNDLFHFTLAKYISYSKNFYYSKTLLRAIGVDLIYIHAKHRFLKYLEQIVVTLVLHNHGFDSVCASPSIANASTRSISWKSSRKKFLRRLM